MCFSMNIQRIPGLLLVLCIFVISSCTKPPQLKSDISLSGSPSVASFAHGQPVILNLIFENTGSTNAIFSTMTDGNLWVISLERDGQAVVPRETIIRYRESLKTLIASNIETLTPGDNASALWTSIMDPPQGSHSLQAVRFNPEGSHSASLYDVGQPGDYKLTLIYRHGDPWAQSTNVFVGETNQVSVSFSVSL